MAPRFPELGFYALAGSPETNRAIVDEIRDGDRLGFGAAFISERFDQKEALTLSGAAAAVSDELTIITGVTNHNLRHPIVTAGHGSTMHELTDGRFALGLGRGFDARFDAYGLPRITTAQMEDFAGLMRRLWRGETVVGHDGPAGRFPALRLNNDLDADVGLAIAAFGPETLRLGGRAFDHVILHTFFTDETLQRCVKIVKGAAEAAGRDPADVTVWSCFATIGDHLDHAARLKKTVGRMATYLQGYGDLMVRTNGWDPSVLERFRADELVQRYGKARRAIDADAGTEDLEHIGTLIPEEWLAPAGYGTPSECASAVRRQIELGADAVIMHGASPAQLEPIVEAYAGLG